MKQFTYISFLLFSILSSCSSQKNDQIIVPKIIKGIVIDEYGLPLPGAYILVKGSKQIAIGDIDGKFEIEVKKKQVLIVRYIGLENAEIKINSKDYYEIIMRKYEPPMNRNMRRYVREHGGVVPEF